ncbi:MULTISPECIES: hypothetical protein [Microbacterium]|uniref:DUF3558 domain-containing protein n=1 Tax=Microbacterium wangchenii TaxID=2541726 RepID=A0ABX5SQ47_9MICO|nr:MULTISPECIES: hypothetical protein [Microbacterium]MCK6066966.1 DUF3558 domain-containing protein [Microbacterium sp. EYE_512]QBR88263.1 hypothetical protein E4K62_05875 [Microbacterium wangchenii]TXK17947.1 hypothetical protein FVP99_04925 [Microbacterium wangchenii]
MMTLRRAPAALAVAIVLLALAGCAQPAPAASTPTATPSASPSPTASATVEPVRVPFDGDCARIFTDDDLVTITGGESSTHSGGSLNAIPPDLPASAAVVGGLDCGWRGDGAGGAYVWVTLIPASVVPAELAQVPADEPCLVHCQRSEVIGDTWALVVVPPVYAAEREPTPEESALVQGRLDAAFQALRAHGAALAGSPGPDTERVLPACDTLAGPVQQAVGVSEPVSGYPTDLFPEGPTWEVLRSQGLVEWCAWYDAAVGVEVFWQADAGPPSDEALAEVAAEPIDVPGADVAYTLTGRADAPAVVVVGDNHRWTLGGYGMSLDALQAAAAAVVAQGR